MRFPKSVVGQVISCMEVCSGTALARGVQQFSSDGYSDNVNTTQRQRADAWKPENTSIYQRLTSNQNKFDAQLVCLSCLSHETLAARPQVIFWASVSAPGNS